MALVKWHLLLALLKDVGAIPGLTICRNPLFEMHWFVQGGIESPLLSAEPTNRTNLRLCPAYNSRPSCCVEAFEVEQILYFNYWKQIFAAKLEGISEVRNGVIAVKQLDVFNAASDSARAQFERALVSLDDVLDPANHAHCFSALLTYVAGMLCFACDAAWKSMVQTDTGKVIRVLLTSNTCHKVWHHCATFGEVVAWNSQMFFDSQLALLQSNAIENMEMFYDQQSLCDWMHDTVALKPFATPPEAQREAAPAPEIIRMTRRLDDIISLDGKTEYDAILAGKASGFDIMWEGSQSSARTARHDFRPLLVFAFSVSCFLAAC